MKTLLATIYIACLQLWWRAQGYKNMAYHQPNALPDSDGLSDVIKVVYFIRGRVYFCQAKYNTKTKWPRLVDGDTHKVIGSLEPVGINLSGFYWKPN